MGSVGINIRVSSADSSVGVSSSMLRMSLATLTMAMPTSTLLNKKLETPTEESAEDTLMLMPMEPSNRFNTLLMELASVLPILVFQLLQFLLPQKLLLTARRDLLTQDLLMDMLQPTPPTLMAMLDFLMLMDFHTMVRMFLLVTFVQFSIYFVEILCV